MEKIVPLPTINMVQGFCYMLDGMLQAHTGEKNQAVMERIFLFCLMWAFGGPLTSDKQTDFRKVFSNFFRSLTKAIKFPESGIVLDYFIDSNTGDAIPWQSKIGNSVGSSGDGSFSSLVIPTAESVRLTYLMDILVRNGRPVMFVGSAGTGKTVLVNDFLSTLVSSDESFKYATINMNFYTDACALQLQLEQHIDKRSGKNFGPPSGKLIYFIDDLNLPFVETYGTQTPIALMRQHIDHGSWFDRTDLSLKKNISDCQYLACMNHKSGSFYVNPRLQRHFVTFAYQMPGDADLFTIFNTILTGHFYTFDKKIQNKIKNITDATIALYKEISQKFLPSAVKFHYNFSMRDLAAVVKGLLNARPQEQTATGQLARLWYHESTRVFSDRLISDMEVVRCREVIMNVGKRFMEDEAEAAFAEPCFFAHYAPKAVTAVSKNMNLMGGGGDDFLSNYRNCDDITRFKTIVEEKLREYNESRAMMNLVMFEQAIRHVLRISRILLFPGGHALLVGVGGSGKQSLSKLASFICNYDIFQISVTSDFGVNDLKEHLRDMYRKAAIKPGEPIVFMLTDSQITDERFLVYINDLLSSGHIPDLFTKEDYDGIFAALRNVAKAEGVPDNRDSMMQFFIQRVKTNLHLILCFSPVGDQFRNRVRKFPGIINCTMIDWFLEWPREALVSVAQRFLETIEIKVAEKPDIKDNIAYHIAEVHTSVGVASANYYKQEKRFNYTTPKSFLELIAFYKNLLTIRRNEMYEGIKRLDTGLLTLQRTNRDVEKLQEFLKEKKKEVEAKKAGTDKLLEEMGQQRSEAEAQQAIADVEKKKADAAAADARVLEEQAAGDLAIAKPALDAANDAVNCLDKNSLTELKGFAKPPAGVDKVTTALLIMIKGEKKDFSWENAKKMMAKVDAFKEKLESYRGEDIPEDVIAKVAPMLEDPEFTYEKMKTKSSAAANLANWVINIIRFNGIYKRVRPLMESLDVATKAKRKAEDDLSVVKEKLQVIENKLATLQSEFTAATDEKAKVEKEAKECMDRLNLAERLTKGLSSEQERWSNTVDQLKTKEITLAGDVMLAASFTCYLGAFNAYFRDKLWKETWLPDLVNRDIPLTGGIDPLLHILSSESQMANWNNEGLPSDRISLENGAILTNSSRWPLLIDPQLQGIRWLKKHAQLHADKMSKKVLIVRIGEKLWMTKIIQAITNGDTVIMENIGENIDAAMDPILTKAVYKKGKTMYLKIGEEDVEYDASFQLYLQTKLSNPHYKPEISAQCTIINFIVTRKGLEDQLLATIVSEEEPELERTRNELVQSFNTYKIQLKELEDLLLERLSNAPEDILSDIPLIEGLEATKQTANEINEAVLKGIQTEIGINAAREVYRVVATEASLSYFTLLQLYLMDHMYQYSLDSFQMFFLKALKSAPAAPSTAERVQSLQLTLRSTIFRFVNRGLFAKHKLIFLTQLTFALIQQGLLGDETGLNYEGLRFLLLGPRQNAADYEKSPVSWINDHTWNGLKALTGLEGFDRLAADIEENAPRFFEWFTNFTPETERLPGAWRELDRNPFKKLLVLRVLRPDRITSALVNFIRELLPNGKEFVECDSELSSYQIIEQCFEDTSPGVPLYFILSPGADVVSDVDKLAVKFKKPKGTEYHNISLGQGQDKVAEEKLEMAARQGHWVFLNNVHLMPKWLVSMEKKLESYGQQNQGGNASGTESDQAANTIGIHPEFRVFFSSDPSNNIPIGILDRCIKITSDPPSGLKANLKQGFACFPKETFEELESRTKGILMGLIQFHAVMVERKKFGSKGFNMNYPFSLGDLTCSFQVLKNYMESAPAKVPWADLRYLFGEIMYGGHIVNDFDRTLANTYLDFYMKEELLEEMSLFPFLDASTAMAAGGQGSGGGLNLTESFKAPPTSASYELVVEHIDEHFKIETPLVFGLHPNAEIGFRTQTSEDLLKMVLELSASNAAAAPASGSGDDKDGGEVQDAQQVVEAMIQDILEQFRDVKFEVDSITSNMDDVGPFQNVILQECERMTNLLAEIIRSLVELDLGFKGDLTVSEAMEELSNSLFLDRVPKKWEILAYPSLRPLGSWLTDLNSRISQLNDWMNNPLEMPAVTWISGLFNPQSFLTAVMQITAQAQSLELDKLTLLTDVTKKLNAEDFNSPAKDGTYISGLFLEGGSWNLNQGLLESARPREMFVPLPVINIRPVIQDRVEAGVFSCPVYKTQQRGPTYVFSLQLKTKFDPGKWVLAGVVSIMDVM
jgi:dynein heavy chain